MDNMWLASALWIALALLSALISIRLALSVALVEIVVGALGGNLIGLPLGPWVNYLAGLGAILLTFLAGAEVDMNVVRRNVGASVGIGVVSFLFPYLGCMLARAICSAGPGRRHRSPASRSPPPRSPWSTR